MLFRLRLLASVLTAAGLLGFPIALAAGQAPHEKAASGTTCTQSSSSSFVGIPSAANVAGGGESAVLGGYGNLACNQWDGIGTGSANSIGNSAFSAWNSFVAGGRQNTISGSDSFIASGFNNTVSGSGSFAGAGNVVQDSANTVSGNDSFVGAGDGNSVSGNGSFVGAGGSLTGSGNRIIGSDAFIGAGDSNSVAGAEAFIGAGIRNSANGAYAALAGGDSNFASGYAAAIPGGGYNRATGEFSFAAGFGAYAKTNGSFVWGDYSGGRVVATNANQFLARATGGVTFLTNAAQTTGVVLAPGSGSWGSLSDRTVKSRIEPVDDSAILAKVSRLPIARWSYKSELGVRHVGPMAQDFHAAFAVGEDDRHITSIDEDGVALAAIQALVKQNRSLSEALRGVQDAQRRSEAENDALRSRLRAIEAAVTALAVKR
jgi:hypothetical protein